MDQRGNAIDVDLGNTVNVIVGFEPLTGLVDYKQSGKGASTTNRQNLDYDWDKNANLIERSDLRQTLTERFFYDAMNRLDYSTLGGVQNLNVDYLANGNIKKKSDVGASDYVYDTNKIHAVITAGANTFEYDANGNAKKRNGSTITWTSYNKPSQISGNGQTSDFWYAPDRSRWKQVATYSSGTETTIYVGGLMEKVTVGSLTSYKHLVTAPDGIVIHRVLRSDSTNDTYYLASDHLGSTDVVLDASGDAVVYTSFDAFGQRRDPVDWSGPPSAPDLTKIKNSTRRGFTGHEHLDNTGLIHMNGRVQDPLVGRFLSADPFVQAPYFRESLNRYSYVFNNSLTYTDPSGFTACDHGYCDRDRYPYIRPPSWRDFWVPDFRGHPSPRTPAPPIPPEVPVQRVNDTQIDVQDGTLTSQTDDQDELEINRRLAEIVDIHFEVMLEIEDCILRECTNPAHEARKRLESTSEALLNECSGRFQPSLGGTPASAAGEVAACLAGVNVTLGVLRRKVDDEEVACTARCEIETTTELRERLREEIIRNDAADRDESDVFGDDRD